MSRIDDDVVAVGLVEQDDRFDGLGAGS